MDACQQFHSIVAAFRATEIQYLFIFSAKMLWILNNSRTAGLAARIPVAGAVRINVKRSWVKLHDADHYMPNP
jgi:hypothetical protein